MTQKQTGLHKSDPPLQEAEIFGVRLTFTEEGSREGPVFMAVHGVPGSVRDFRYLAPPLAAFARLIRVDLPGSGGSTPRREALRSLASRAETVLALADGLGIDRFGIIGHSMGTGTALLAASMKPDRISHLVMIAPMGLRPHRALSRSRTSFRRIAFMLGMPGLGRLLLPEIKKHYRKRRFPGVEEMTARDFAIQFESFSAADFSVMKRAAARPLPDKTLVAFADDDHLVEPAIPLELAAAIRGAKILRFDEGGHIIQKTKAAEIAQAIRDL